MNGASSAISIHTFVFKGRHGIKENLGILKNVVPLPQLQSELSKQNVDNESGK